MTTLWRTYKPWAWLALFISLVVVALLATTYVNGTSWVALAGSYLAVLFIGVQLRGVFQSHHRDFVNVYVQVATLRRLNARYDLGEIGPDEWVKGAEQALGREPPR